MAEIQRTDPFFKKGHALTNDGRVHLLRKIYRDRGITNMDYIEGARKVLYEEFPNIQVTQLMQKLASDRKFIKDENHVTSKMFVRALAYIGLDDANIATIKDSILATAVERSSGEILMFSLQKNM